MPHPHRLALNVELTPDASGGAPEWVEMIPAGPNVSGRDGRAWVYDDQSRHDVQQAFAARGMDLLIDWEHASELRAPKGEEAPAAGWGVELQDRDGGALWGRVNWTPRASVAIGNREYRYLSPVFEYDPTTRRIHRLVSCALVNQPNLPLKALNREETPVTVSAQIAKVLGLSADATEEAAVAAIDQLKTAKAANTETATPSLDKFVPRADYDTLMARASNAEAKLVERDQAEHQAAVDAAIGGALKAGKIAPASEAFYRASCKEADGLTRFEKFVEGAPVIGDASELDKRKAGGSATALNAEEQAVAKAFGLSAEDFAKAKSTDHQ